MTSFGILAAGMAIILAASFIQSLTSFGFALISLPLLSLFLPLRQAVPLIVIFSLVTSLMVFIPNRRDVNVRQIWLLIAAGMLAAPFGAYLLLVVSAQTLKAAIGILITLFAALMLFGRSLPMATRDLRLGHSQLGDRAGVVGAAIMVVEHVLDPAVIHRGAPGRALLLNEQGHFWVHLTPAFAAEPWARVTDLGKHVVLAPTRAPRREPSPPEPRLAPPGPEIAQDRDLDLGL